MLRCNMETIIAFAFILNEAASTVALKQEGGEKWCAVTSTHYLCHYENLAFCERNLECVKDAYSCELNPRQRGN